MQNEPLDGTQEALLEGKEISPRKTLFNAGTRLTRQSNSFCSLRSPPSRQYVCSENPDPNVAFTVLVKREGEDDNDSPSNGDDGLVNVAHEVVSEAVQTVRPNRAAPLFKDNTIGYEPSCLNTIATYFKVCGQAVQEAVQDAIQQALDENVRFDVRANVFTLIAITGVILFWRGIWSLWDKVFGFSIWSELGSIASGLLIMITFRLIGVPLLDGLPSG